MLKRLILTLLSFVTGSFFVANVSYAVPTIEKSSQTWKCLKGTDTDFRPTWHDPPSPATYVQKLSGDGFIDGKDIFVVGCMASNNTVCTSGEKDIDMSLFGKDNTTQGQRNVYGEEITYNVLKVDGGSRKRSKNGKFDTSATVGGVNAVHAGGYTFYGVMIIPQNNIVEQPGLGAEQQGTFSFTGKDDLSKCVKISWTHVDPFGIVFDSKSLEPLQNVLVTILDNNKKKINFVGFPNPQITQADGLFNFLVDPGEYYLDIHPIPQGYQFKENPSIHQNYKKIYHQADGGDSIYKPGVVIREIIDTPDEQVKGVPDPERRDIPLDPGEKTPFTTSPVIINYGVTRLENDTKIEGKTSHPYTAVTILQGNETIASQEATREGFFEFLIENVRIRQDLAMTLRLSKKNLTGNLDDVQARNLLSPVKQLQSDVISYLSSIFSAPHLVLNVQAQVPQLGKFKIIQPIFKILKGYAYDKSGKTVPNADVDIKLAMTNASVYRAKADQNGYFDIPSENLPIFNYDVSFSSSFSPAPITYSTSEFAKANKTYLTKNNINLLGASTKRKTEPTKSPNSSAFSGSRDAVQSDNVATNTIPPIQQVVNEKKQMTKASKNTSAILVLASFLLASIVLLVVGIYFFIKRKRNLQQQ
jgi:hypothetical protein